MPRNLDIILFGATGFTGTQAIPLIHEFAKKYQLKWGVAGRSERKLTELLNQSEKKIGSTLNQIPIIIANINDEKSLNDMARQARIIVNCCGPYRFFGEPVIKACVKEATHHVDVSGEPQYMEKVQLKYHEAAKEKGIYIISACGFDSVPADLGVVYLENQFKGTVNSVEAYLELWEEGQNETGPVLNSGTWESVVYVLGFAKELRSIRNQLYPKLTEPLRPKLGFKLYPHKNDLVEGWILPNLGSDRSVIRRSQYSFFENDSKRPIQIQTYYVVQSFIAIIKLAFVGLMLSIFSRFSWGRNLLLKYPKFFSAGLLDGAPPNEEKIKNGRFSIICHGKGWTKIDQEGPPNDCLSVKVKGSNPAYGTACTCLVLAAITVLEEPTKLPSSGGVYSPGYAFAKTSLIQRLNDNGVTFEVLNLKK